MAKKYVNKIEFSVWQKLGIKLSGEKMIDETLGPKFGYSLFSFFFFSLFGIPALVYQHFRNNNSFWDDLKTILFDQDKCSFF